MFVKAVAIFNRNVKLIMSETAQLQPQKQSLLESWTSFSNAHHAYLVILGLIVNEMAFKTWQHGRDSKPLGDATAQMILQSGNVLASKHFWMLRLEASWVFVGLHA